MASTERGAEGLSFRNGEARAGPSMQVGGLLIVLPGGLQ